MRLSGHGSENAFLFLRIAKGSRVFRSAAHFYLFSSAFILLISATVISTAVSVSVT